MQAFQGAGVTLITEANNHGEDCGLPGLQTALSVRADTGYPILGIGRNVDDAFTPYRATINGEKITIIAATQVIDSDLQTSWTATSDHAGLASAYDVGALVSAVEAARRSSDTVIVYLHWGTELDACPNPLQEPLAQVLVAAGADIVVGTHAHVLLGGGYLGSAYVDYGLGNFAFYDNSPPENQSGSLVITATGRRIDSVTWRPAVIVNDLPQPLTGAAATAAVGQWNAARGCTDVTATPSAPISSPSTETAPARPRRCRSSRPTAADPGQSRVTVAAVSRPFDRRRGSRSWSWPGVAPLRSWPPGPGSAGDWSRRNRPACRPPGRVRRRPW